MAFDCVREALDDVIDDSRDKLRSRQLRDQRAVEGPVAVSGGRCAVAPSPERSASRSGNSQSLCVGGRREREFTNNKIEIPLALISINIVIRTNGIFSKRENYCKVLLYLLSPIPKATALRVKMTASSKVVTAAIVRTFS